MSEELGKFLNGILDRIKDFFEIIDLSMIIAGAFAILIVYWWQFLNGFTFEILHLKEYSLFIHFIIAYCLGLIAFTFGRLIRRKVLRLNGKTNDISYCNQKIDDHKLSNDPKIKIFGTLGDSSRRSLREFLWSELRQNKDYGYSKSFLNKYWSMSVIFDSLAGVSFLFLIVWSDLLFGIYGTCNIACDLLCITKGFLMIIPIIFSICFMWMPIIYDNYQDDELLASYAALKRSKEFLNAAQP